MTLIPRTLKAAALLSLVVVVGAGAQERKLTEADVRKVMPVLRAEAGMVAAASQTASEATTGLSGDPLDFFRSRTRINLPETAKYQPQCSLAASAARPVAIFTFGRSIDCYNRTWRDWARTTKRGPDEKLQAPAMAESCNAEGLQTKNYLEGVREALEKRNWVVEAWGDVDRYLASADGSVNIGLHPYNVYDRAESVHTQPLMAIESEQAREKALAACSLMPSGPILVLRPGGGSTGMGPGDLGAALKKAGLTEQEYDDLKTALLLARMDAEQGGMLEALEAAAGGDPALRQTLVVRRANVDLYRKLASELDPILDKLVPRQ